MIHLGSRYPWMLLLVLVAVVVGCTPTAPATPGAALQAGQSPQSEPSDPGRTLVIAIGRAPDSLAAKPMREVRGSASPNAVMGAFNAGLVLHDERNRPRPYLAEAIPELGSESWRVLPDGGMETTYRLRPDLVWHDGTPLTAEDFVFAGRVYATPDLGLAASPPVNMLESVVAVDPRTVRFRWTQTYAAADDLQAGDFAPLPRHLLEAPFLQREPDAFVAHPFWMSDYVGAGPYRVRQIELGTFVGGEAFERFVLGRPKINSIRLVPITDANTVLANLLAGAAHAATDNTIDLQQAVVLEREWSSRGGSAGGVVIRSPIGVRFSNFQLRPEYASPRSLTDVRVRKAVAHSTDRQSLADGTLEGLTTVAEAIVLREVEYFPALDRVSAKYPLDRQRASQLMTETGWALGPDGIYASPTEGRFTLELRTVEGARNSAELAIMADGLRQMGIDATIRALSRPERTVDPMLVGNFPGIFTGHNTHAVDPPLEWFRADEIIRVETRGRGSNYSGFNHPEVERLVHAFETTLDRSQREQHLVQALKIVSEEVPLFPLYYSLGFVAHAGNVRGPVMGVSREVATWNLHEWYWTS